MLTWADVLALGRQGRLRSSAVLPSLTPMQEGLVANGTSIQCVEATLWASADLASAGIRTTLSGIEDYAHDAECGTPSHWPPSVLNAALRLQAV